MATLRIFVIKPGSCGFVQVLLKNGVEKWSQSQWTRDRTNIQESGSYISIDCVVFRSSHRLVNPRIGTARNND